MYLSMNGQTSVEVLAKPTLLTLFCSVPLLLCYKIRNICFNGKSHTLGETKKRWCTATTKTKLETGPWFTTDLVL